MFLLLLLRRLLLRLRLRGILLLLRGCVLRVSLSRVARAGVLWLRLGVGVEALVGGGGGAVEFADVV